MLSLVRVDLSAAAREGLAAISLRLIRSSNDESADSGLVIGTQLAFKAAASEAQQLLASTFLDALQGKGGAVLTSSQRLAAAKILLESSNRTTPLPDALMNEVVKTLLNATDKEADETCKTALAVCAGHWLAKAGAVSPEISVATADRLKKGAESSIPAVIACVVSCYCNPSLRSGFAGVCARLIEIIKEANKRPQQGHHDAVLALNLLLQVSSADSKVREQITSQNLWSVLSQTSSFLYSNQTIRILHENSSKLYNGGYMSESIVNIFAMAAQQNIDCLKKLMETVSDDDAFSLPSDSIESQPGPYQLLLSALFVEDYGLRQRITTRLPIIFEAVKNSMLGIVVTLRQFVIRVGLEVESEEKKKLESVQSSSAETANISYLQATTKVRNALSTLGSVLSMNDTAIYANSLMIYGHPLVNRNSVKAAYALLKPHPIRCSFSSSDSVDKMMRLLSGCIYHSSEMVRRCGGFCCNLVLLHLSEDGTAWLKKSIVPEVLRHLDRRNFENISEHDIEIYLNPVLEEPKLEEISLADIKITNEDRKGKRGKFGADIIEDEDWAEQIKREKAKKLMEVRAEAHREAKAKRSKEAEEVLARVGSVMNRVEGALSFFEFALQHCPTLIIDNYDAILALIGCMSFKLVSSIATRCVVRRALLLEKSLHPISRCST